MLDSGNGSGSEIDQLIIKKENELNAGKEAENVALPAPPDDSLDIEVYKRIVKPTCLLLSWGIDKINRRFIRSGFRPMNDEQIALVEPDMSFVLKDALDKIIPDLAKKNPRAVSLALLLGVVYASNTYKIIEEPVKKPVDPADPVSGQENVHTVEVTNEAR